MVSNQQASLPRSLAVGAGATLAYGALTAWLLPVVTTEDGGTTFDAALARLCAAAAVLAAGWLWLATVLTVLAALRGRQDAAGVLPAPLRRVVLAACGVALTGGLLASGAAHATPGPQHQDRVAHPAAAVAGLPLPDRPTDPVPPQTVVVAPGDTLWAIAARTLGPGASNAEIDAAWRRIHDLNRAEIGPDPDLIRPAQRLEVLP